MIDQHAESADIRASSPVLRACNLSVSYHDRTGTNVPAVCGVNLEIVRREIVGIFGPSGSGKTSLGLALLGLLPPTAICRAEAIELEGTSLLDLSQRQLRSIRGRRISMMHQEPALSLNPVMKVGQQIGEIILAHEACTRPERHTRVLELLRCVGLSNGMYDSYPQELSGGERHRIVIAQALACRPALVIADEPTAGLDPDLKSALLDLILRLKSEMSVSFLVISHDRKMLAQIADRTLQMTLGRLSESRARSDEKSASFRAAFRIPDTGLNKERSEPLIAVRGLSKSFCKHSRLFRSRSFAVQAVREVDFSIPRGASIGLTGPSGSGKTTLAKCIAGWERPDSGQILFQGDDATKFRGQTAERTRFKIQLLLQDSAAAFNPNLTAEEIVEEPLLVQHAGNKEQRRAAVKRLFLETGLEEDMLMRKPLAFSGGQRQRLAIARALISSPELIIFDESMTGLDSETQEQILNLLARLKAARSLTYLLISHDADVLNIFADTVATMRNGTIVNVEPRSASTELSHSIEKISADGKAFATGEVA